MTTRDDRPAIVRAQEHPPAEVADLCARIASGPIACSTCGKPVDMRDSTAEPDWEASVRFDPDGAATATCGACARARCDDGPRLTDDEEEKLMEALDRDLSERSARAFRAMAGTR